MPDHAQKGEGDASEERPYAGSRIRRRPRPGTPPGQLIADPHAHPTVVSAIAYAPDWINQAEISDPQEIARLADSATVLWVDVVGLKDVAFIEELGADFGVHPLALEDVVNVHQRAKAEEYEATLYTVLRIPALDGGAETEQISIVFGEGFVLTFQERPGDPFGLVRNRLRRKGARIREKGADYLGYALVDAVIDAYFPALEEVGERLESLEDRVVGNPGAETVESIHLMKRELLGLRRAIWPHRETVNALLRQETSLIGADIHPYLRDCYDHAVQQLDIVETYREIASGLLDVYLSSLSNRMNEIMKVLTIIATIFIPLTFIAGIYGMNFDPDSSPWNMPELTWPYGYPAALGSMAVIAVGLLYWFRKRGWLGGGRRG